MPALGLSLFLMALGAILTFAINVSVTGVSLAAVGVILMLVGLVGIVLSMLFWTSFAPFSTSRDRTVIRDYEHHDVHDMHHDVP